MSSRSIRTVPGALIPMRAFPWSALTTWIVVCTPHAHLQKMRSPAFRVSTKISHPVC